MLLLLPTVVLLAAWLTHPTQKLMSECSPDLESGVSLHRVSLIGTSGVFFDL